MKSLRRTLARWLSPLAYRDYALLSLGMVLSSFAAGMWSVAMIEMVRELGAGPVQLSLVASANAAGMLLLVLHGGIAADRFSSRKIVLYSEVLLWAVMSIIAVLSLAGVLQLWHLVLGGLFMGIGSAFFLPAYSALLPRLLPADKLLLANGVEGTIFPLVQTAMAPMLAGAMIAMLSPQHAIILIALCHLLTVLVLPLIKARGKYDNPTVAQQGGGEPGAGRLLLEGARYVQRTGWLRWTLLYLVVSAFTFIGPFEVLLPFVVSDQLGGDSTLFGLSLAFFGIGAAAGALLVSIGKFPRRYLSLMTLCWCVGTLPLALIGFVDAAWMLFAILLVYGLTDAVGNVIWGTMLLRRVPAALLGRVASLEAFVSFALMPVSLAIAGPLSQIASTQAIFLVVGTASPLVGLLAWWGGKFTKDEHTHPL